MMNQRVVLIGVCCLLIAPCGAHAQLSAAAAVPIWDSIGRIVDSPLIKKIYDQLTRAKTPVEEARPRVRALYSALLDARSEREDLKSAVRARLLLLQSNASASELSVNRDEIFRDTQQLGKTLDKLRAAFRSLNVDLDAYYTTTATDIQRYAGGNQEVVNGMSQTAIVDRIEGNAWSLDKPNDLKAIVKKLQANDRLISNSILEMRRLTRQQYPNFGELLPGASMLPQRSTGR